MSWIAKTAIILVAVLIAMVLYYRYLEPRPADTTDSRIYEQDAHALNYCSKSELTGAGLSADDIAKAYTPHCGFDQWPAPVLAGCTEPLAEGADDLRGLWQAVDGHIGHIERIEQCGNRVIVLNNTFIHDFRTTGNLSSGVNDIHPVSCLRTRAAVHWDENKALIFRAFNLVNVVSRRLADEDTLIWQYFGKKSKLKRICKLPT